MKTYSSLSIDVIHFEAQDIVTASTPDIAVTCICTATYCHDHRTDCCNTGHGGDNGCQATTHNPDFLHH